MLQGRFSANATGVQSPGTTANLADGARIKAILPQNAELSALAT